MFTGIVEEIGRVVAVERDPDAPDARLTVAAARVLDGTRVGDSIAVAGVCLTVTSLQRDGAGPDAPGRFTADVMPETLDRSALGGLGSGDPVNLERAVPVTGRLDGHIVQGHVDGVGTVLHREPGPRWDVVRVGVDRGLARYLAEKGSVAVSGVSLTVTAVADDAFEVALIPTTLAATTLGAAAPGVRLNIEVDVIAKYTERLLGLPAPGEHGSEQAGGRGPERAAAGERA